MPNHPPYLWLNGEFVPWESATIHITDARSLLSVTAVYEGIRGYWDADDQQVTIFRLDDHLRRFADSMKVLRMQPRFTSQDLAAAAVDLVRRNGQREDVYIRPVATYAPLPGDSWAAPDPSHLEIVMYATARPTSLDRARNVNVGISSWRRIDDNSMPPRVKSNANYLSSRLVSDQARLDGYDGAIILNADGKVAEGPWACVCLVRDGKLVTPAVTNNILESITRRTLLQLAREVVGIPVEERAVDRTELYLADELFFCGTGQELMPIVSVDRYPIGSGDAGPVTARLRRLYYDVARGREDRYRGWVTPVY